MLLYINMATNPQKRRKEIYDCIMNQGKPSEINITDDNRNMYGNKLVTEIENVFGPNIKRYSSTGSTGSWTHLDNNGDSVIFPNSLPIGIPQPPPPPPPPPLGFGAPTKLPVGNAAQARPNLGAVLANLGQVKLKSSEEYEKVTADINNKLGSPQSALAEAAAKAAGKRTKPIGNVGSEANKQELENKALIHDYAQTLNIVPRGQFLGKTYEDKIRIATAWKNRESNA